MPGALPVVVDFGKKGVDPVNKESVLAALDKHDGKTILCLCRESGLPRIPVQNALRVLVRDGVAVRTPPKNTGMGRIAGVYRLAWNLSTCQTRSTVDEAMAPLRAHVGNPFGGLLA